jgi:hypothetical protein
MKSKACFDWNENTPDVGNLDGMVRLIDEAIEKNKAKMMEKNPATSQPLGATAQPIPTRRQEPPRVPHLARPLPPSKPAR